MNQLLNDSTGQEHVTTQEKQVSTAFLKFISKFEALNSSNLHFKYCDKYVRFKKSQYMKNQQVIDYFLNVFQREICQLLRKKWHIKDKFVFLWIVTKYCEIYFINEYKMKLEDWQAIANIIGLETNFIMRKWICLLRHTTEHFHWIEEEQKILMKYMSQKQYYMKWSQVSIKIFYESGSQVLRTCKDIRQRWKNYLDPNLKKYHIDNFRSRWNQEEDRLLLQMIKLNGTKWSAIAQFIPGRTQNQVKNRYRTLQNKSKSKKSESSDNSSHTTFKQDNDNELIENKSEVLLNHPQSNPIIQIQPNDKNYQSNKQQSNSQNFGIQLVYYDQIDSLLSNHFVFPLDSQSQFI